SAAYSALPYLDPGSGSILIQLAVAALLGAGLFIRSQWSKIKKMLGKDVPEVNEEENADDDFEE
nr:hypothetical protein [Candidatus Desulfolinea nitratireducens]